MYDGQNLVGMNDGDKFVILVYISSCKSKRFWEVGQRTLIATLLITRFINQILLDTPKTFLIQI